MYPFLCYKLRSHYHQVLIHQFNSVQSLSRVWLFATPWIAARQTSLSITNSQSSLRLTSIESVMPSSHLILCRPLSSCPQSLPASESSPMSQLFAWGGQSTGVSALASFLPKNHRFLENQGNLHLLGIYSVSVTGPTLSALYRTSFNLSNNYKSSRHDYSYFQDGEMEV